jgi:hypothetical protein
VVSELEVLIAVAVDSYVFWDATMCSPVKVSHVSEEHVTSVVKAEE